MRIGFMIIFSILHLSFLSSCKNVNKEISEEQLRQKAMKICENNIILDSHIDWPELIYENPEDISGRTKKGDFDLVRAKEGGLDAVLSVLYISSHLGVGEGRIMVDSLLEVVNYYTWKYPDKFAPAYNPGDIRKNFRKGLLSLPLCLENGSPIGNDLGYLKWLKDQGIVYITLCHNKNNQISDSNFDEEKKWNGLSPFGLEVINEMNRLGIMIDISHSTDSTVFQVLRHSKAPIAATHSCCRHFTPGLERNLPDTLIKAIAEKNGVIMVNFASFFLDSVCRKNWLYLEKIFNDSTGIDPLSEEGLKFIREYKNTHQLYSDSKKVADHIDHIVELAGIDHVGIGSDYDGIGYSQPSDLPDVSSYPVIVYELLKRGYTEKEIKKILSGNFLRVWDDVIKVAGSMQKNSTVL
jgi:membrane dipeptidase